MPIVNRAKRLLIETLANNINEMVVGFDSSFATADDTAAGRPVTKLTPTVKIFNDTMLLVEAKMGTQYEFDESISEVFLQHRATDGTYTPIARFNMPNLTKTALNEYVIQIIMEVA